MKLLARHVRKQDSNPFMTLLDTRQLQEMDVQHHLHPFTDTKILKENGSRIITKAEGVYLWDSDGNKIIDDTAKYLENYKRIVRLIGDSFPDTGMEILLHNLTNPSKALYHIKNNVTGRNIDAPATNLVHDLKMRDMQNQDKLNYELNIGSRKFKCTTIPIYRDGYGLVGAICINVDYHYINEEVRRDEKKLNSFINSICKTDMILDENILSEDFMPKTQRIYTIPKNRFLNVIKYFSKICCFCTHFI